MSISEGIESPALGSTTHAPSSPGDGTPEAVLLAAVDAIEDLQDRVDQLESRLAPPTAGVSEETTAWVAWLRQAYELEDLPEAWVTIPGAHQELVAIHAAWTAAHDDEGVPTQSADAVAWHDSLERALSRINELWNANHRRRAVMGLPN